MRRRKLFTFGLACAVVAALSAASPSLAAAARTSASIAPAVAKPAAAKPAAPAEAIKWGPWKHVIGGGSGTLTALGCLTATDCVAWDFNQEAQNLVRWNGSAWSTPAAIKLAGPPEGQLQATSCPTSTFCMTVGGVVSHGMGGAGAWVYAGGRWTATKPSGEALQYVSCASPAFCVATSQDGGVSEYNGKTWTTAAYPAGASFPASDDVSCASAAFCVFITSAHAIWQWNGKSWQQTVAALTGASGLVNVSCVTSTWCLAVDNAGDVYKYDGASWTAAGTDGTAASFSLVCTSKAFCLVGGTKLARFNGASWTVSPYPFHVGNEQLGLSGLSCVGQACVGLAQGPYGVLSSTFVGGRWTGQKLADSSFSLGPVSCPTTSFCAAVGGPISGTGWSGLIAETWQHGTWTAPVYLPTGVVPFGHTGDLTDDLSCASATFCLADETYGRVWRYNGRTWAVIASPPAASPGITGLSCARPTFCVATVTPSTNSKHQPTSSGIAVFNGSRWTAVKSWTGDTGHWQYVTCPNATFCMLSDYFNHLATFNGKSGRQLKSPEKTPNTEGHWQISCASADFCAMPQYYDAVNYPITSGVDIFNGRSWSYHYLSSGGWLSGGVINEVACAPHTKFCIARDTAGRSFSYNGSQWSRAAVTHDVGYADVSCASAKLCVAIGLPGAAIGT